jgi:HK97 family phage major capsid protein
LTEFITKAQGQIDTVGKANSETLAAINKIAENVKGVNERLLDLEQKAAQGKPNTAAGNSEETLGARFAKTDAWKAVVAGTVKSARMEVKTALVNATGASQPLVPEMRVPGIVTPFTRRLTIRDLLPVGRTSSNLVQFAKENVFTNNAGPQYASPNRENVTKPESGITFTLASAEVATLAHWIPVSKQVLSDAPMLESYINTRMIYGLKLKEEDELLNGDGLTGNLGGILKSGNFTAYNTALTKTGDTRIDTLRRAILQAALSEYAPSAIVLNPTDWAAIELTKDTTGRYIFSNPQSQAAPALWGLPVVSTNSLAATKFLTGAFDQGAQVWDREDASVAISFEDGTNFVKNMATILAEERIALAIYRPAAFIYGTFV